MGAVSFQMGWVDKQAIGCFVGLQFLSFKTGKCHRMHHDYFRGFFFLLLACLCSWLDFGSIVVAFCF